jgi:hypothetical protein
MNLVPNPELYIPNVLTALSTVFSGCNSTLVKVITSQRGDKEQLLHTDFDLKYITSRVFNLDSLHYSAIIALQPDTHLLVSGKRERIGIPVNSMLLFHGNLPQKKVVPTKKPMHDSSFHCRHHSIHYQTLST